MESDHALGSVTRRTRRHSTAALRTDLKRSSR